MTSEGPVDKRESQLERITTILNDYKGRNFFATIKDPVEWQRELRREWDRDFNINFIPLFRGLGG